MCLTGGAWGEYAAAATAGRGAHAAAAGTPALPHSVRRARALSLGAAPVCSPRTRCCAPRAWYLNPTFFVIRTIVYFVLWLVSAVDDSDAALGNPDAFDALPRLAAVGLIVYALSTLLAATDWAMSLLPHWHSSTFGMMVATGWMLAAAALAVLCALKPRIPPTCIHRTCCPIWATCC